MLRILVLALSAALLLACEAWAQSGSSSPPLTYELVINGESWFTPAGACAEFDYVRFRPLKAEELEISRVTDPSVERSKSCTE